MYVDAAIAAAHVQGQSLSVDTIPLQAVDHQYGHHLASWCIRSHDCPVVADAGPQHADPLLNSMSIDGSRRHVPGEQLPRSSVASWLLETPAAHLLVPPPSRQESRQGTANFRPCCRSEPMLLLCLHLLIRILHVACTKPLALDERPWIQVAQLSLAHRCNTLHRNKLKILKQSCDHKHAPFVGDMSSCC